MFGYIYETVCLENEKIYVGCKVGTPEHTKVYLGSGTYFKQALNKYGRINFVKRIIDFADSKEQLMELEKYWIAKLDSRNKEVGYNITEGGSWGDTISQNPNRDEILKKISNGMKGRTPWNKGKGTAKPYVKRGRKNRCNGLSYEEYYGEEKAVAIKEKISLKATGRKSELKGTHLSDETRKKISKSREGFKPTDESNKKRSETLKGKSCPNKGKIWVTNGITDTFIFKEQLNEFIKNNFRRGRTNREGHV